MGKGVAILVENAMFVVVLCGIMSDSVIRKVSYFARTYLNHVCVSVVAKNAYRSSEMHRKRLRVLNVPCMFSLQK